MTVNLKGGVLIIGSLLWQDHLKESDSIRKIWRDKHLQLNKKIMLKVPIRYGRLSKSGVFTMTFSTLCSRVKQGTGYFIPFKNNSLSLNALIQEAKEVSVAEGMDKKFLAVESKTRKAWCVLGILLNPATINAQSEKIILKRWKSILDSEGEFDIDDFKVGREKPCINRSGGLNLKWPIVIDKRDSTIFNGFDFIIATATKPTQYPSAKELTESVKTDKKRNYFIENYKSGITTFQDIEVINRL